MMKVLISGISNDRVEMQLARELSGNGIDPFLLAASNSQAAGMAREQNLTHIAYGFRGRMDLGGIKLYRQLQSRHHFDIVHCMTNRALSNAIIAFGGMVKRPVLIAYRGTSGHLSRWDPLSYMSYLNKGIARIVCVSNSVKLYLRSLGVPEERLVVIPKGHDPRWYRSVSRSRLQDFGVPLDATVVCFTGNIRPVKGVSFLLEAFEGFTAKDNVQLLIIGEVRDRVVQRKLARRPAFVHAIGFHADAASLAGACDICVMPSIKREGLPKAVLESMFRSIPPIVSNAGGMPEVVLHGQSGLVVPPGDAAALGAAILKLSKDAHMRTVLGQGAYERVMKDYHFCQTLEKTLGLYEQLVRG